MTLIWLASHIAVPRNIQTLRKSFCTAYLNGLWTKDYSFAPVPFVASFVMAPLALTGAGSEAQKNKYLPKLAAGETISESIRN